MNDMEEVSQVLQAFCIALRVATFLLNTGRALKAIELCKECLIFLKDKSMGKENQFGKIIYGAIFNTMFKAYQLISDYTNAIKYGKELLVIYHECGDTAFEGKHTITLANIYERQCKYTEARELYEKAIKIMRETGDRKGESKACGKIGNMCYHLGEYDKAKEYEEKALAIRIEIGDREGEAACYGNLGNVFESLGEYNKAKEYQEKALAIRIEIGDREGESACYGNLATVFKSLGEYGKAREYLEKALAIEIEIGDRAGEATNYGNLATVFKSLGEYDKAKEYHEKALAIKIEIGDRAGEATCYGNLATVFAFLSEYGKAREYLEKALAIRIEIGARREEASCYGNLGNVFESLGEYNKAKEYLEKALAIRIEIGDRAGEAADYGNLGTVFKALGEYDKAKEYHEKALAIEIEIGDREGEAVSRVNLGKLFLSLGDHVMAEGFLKKALSISQDIGNPENEFGCYDSLAFLNMSQGKVQEAIEYLFLSLQKREDLRGFLRDNDQFKISFVDANKFPYHALSLYFCFSGNPVNALNVLELSRARALADLMATQYSVKRQISADPQSSWIGIENIIKKERNCVCMYISYYEQKIFLWILKTSAINFCKITVNENVIGVRLVSSLDDFLAKSFRSLGISSQLDCEDRSLNSSEPAQKVSQEEKLADLRLIEEDDDDHRDPEPSLPLLHKMLIAPGAHLLKEPEIIIVPERSLYQVPFAALTDEDGKYLSETFRIRIVPSLSTLKLIQDSPADYHSQTGALIVGDPVVGRVRYKGRVMNFLPLPCARKEAEIIGELLGVQPLLGQHATKEAVLQGFNSASLIHFAAHGSAERGEIALSPVHTAGGIPEEEDFLLTMSDISQVQLRAKLVVLSCCHSGRGQIRVEGVIGIARAFLGSGARSVLVALWAIEDRATEQLMRHFYEHLVRGESASESLHEAMKWMRGNGFTDVSEWAPFMLIGDNVTFDFGN